MPQQVAQAAKIELSGYEIGSPLGEGGMATVYKGKQLSLDRDVAVKVLNATLLEDAHLQAQFQQESKLIAKLNHPNIIQVIDQGISENNQPWFVMQYVKCVPLDAVAKRADVALTRKLDILVQIAQALSYAHRNGIVHRDIKPANVLVDYEGHVRVVDFGIAGYFETQSGSGTAQDVVMGTPAYMAPEQNDPHQQVTHLSDIYSLGVLAHELILGYLPNQKVEQPKKVHKTLLAVINDCLQEDSAFRPQSVEAVRQRLLQLLQGQHLQDKSWEEDRQRDAISADYKLLDVLKENQYGATYLVHESKCQHLLVIKKQSVAYQGRAYELSKKIAGLSHPHIATIYGTAKNERVFIAVVEYVEGGSLAGCLTQAFSLDHWLLLARQLCRALLFAHQQEIIHGNLRPSNILMVSAGHIKLADFGFEDHSVGEGVDWYQPFDDEKTVVSDIYSVGAVLFHLLTGQVVEHDTEGVKNLNALKVLPKPLAKLLKHMLQAKPKDRPKSMEEVCQVLEQFTDEAKTEIHLAAESPKQQTARPGNRKWAVVIAILVLLFFIAEGLWLFGSLQ